MCVLTPFWSAPPSHVYIEGNKSERKKKQNSTGASRTVPAGWGKSSSLWTPIAAPPVPPAGVQAPNLPSHPKSHYIIIMSPCVYFYFSLQRRRGRLYVLMYYVYYCQNVSAGCGLMEVSWCTAQIGFFFSWSHWSNMNFLCSRSRPHCQDMGRSPQLESCECVFLLCVWMLHSCFHLSVWCCRRASSVRWPHPPCLCWAVKILMMVTQAECWDYVVLFWWLFFFSFQHGQGVVSPSVYVNSCHTKKSHINSKRHNKLLLWDNSAVCCCFHPTMQIFCASHMNDFRCTIPGLDVRGSSCTMATTEKSRFLQ